MGGTPAAPGEHVPGQHVPGQHVPGQALAGQALAGPALAGQTASGQVVRGSIWFLVSIAIMAVGGFVAWGVAARVQPVEVVGNATALFASLLFVVYLTGMGLPVAIARFGHGTEATTEGLWAWAVVYASVASAVGSILFVAIAPGVLGPEVTGPLTDLGPLSATVLLTVLVAGTAWAALTEMRLMTLRAWPWIMLRAAITVTVRIPLIFTPLAAEPLGLFVIMAAPAALSGVVGVTLLSLRRGARRWVRLIPTPEGLAGAWRYASVNWVATLAAQAPQYVAPLVVAAAVSTDVNAGFYLAWSIATVVFLVPHSIGQVVVSEATRTPGRMRHHVALGLAVSVAVGALATLTALAGRSLVTGVFGEGYATTAQVLPWLCVASLPWAVTSMCLAVARTRGTWVGTMVITGGFAVLTLVPLVVLVPARGVDGAAAGWILGNLAAALVATAYTAAERLYAGRQAQPTGVAAPVTP